MSTLPTNIQIGTHLGISISGTAYLQRSDAAGVAAGVLPRNAEETTTPGETATQALSKASAATIKAIEDALQKVDPNASLTGYKDGESFYGQGMHFTLEA